MQNQLVSGGIRSCIGDLYRCLWVVTSAQIDSVNLCLQTNIHTLDRRGFVKTKVLAAANNFSKALDESCVISGTSQLIAFIIFLKVLKKSLLIADFEEHGTVCWRNIYNTASLWSNLERFCAKLEWSILVKVSCM